MMRTSANGKRPHLERTHDTAAAAAEAAVNPRNLRLKRGRRADDGYPGGAAKRALVEWLLACRLPSLLPGSCTMQQQL